MEVDAVDNEKKSLTNIGCYPCMVRMALAAGQLSHLPEERLGILMNGVCGLLQETAPDMPPPRIAGKIFDFLKDEILYDPSADPYRTLKDESNRLAREALPELENYLADHDNGLEAGLKVAAMGNAVDFGAKDHKEVDVRQELADPDSLTFSVNNSAGLIEDLARAGTLLYLADNCGEIILDGLLIDMLQKKFPALDITMAVRDTAVLNDATLEDARACGLDAKCRVISSGSRVPGTVLDGVSEEFLDLFGCADVVIAKGQGNYESLLGTDKKGLYFIFKIKCDPVARLVGGKVGELVVTT